MDQNTFLNSLTEDEYSYYLRTKELGEDIFLDTGRDLSYDKTLSQDQELATQLSFEEKDHASELES